MSAASVVCPRCGWRSRRVRRPCECDREGGGCVCGPAVGYGRCVRCPSAKMEALADVLARAERARGGL